MGFWWIGILSFLEQNKVHFLVSYGVTNLTLALKQRFNLCVHVFKSFSPLLPQNDKRIQIFTFQIFTSRSLSIWIAVLFWSRRFTVLFLTNLELLVHNINVLIRLTRALRSLLEEHIFVVQSLTLSLVACICVSNSRKPNDLE